MSRQPLSSIDTAWLRMEIPTNLMMITGIMVFGAPMDWQRLRATIEHRLLRFDRFRQRVVRPSSPLGTPYWEDDPNFDLDFHLKRVALPRPTNHAALQNAASALMSTPLDFSRPLWQIHFVERYGKGCAFIVRLHHCIADGIALVHVLLSLADKTPDAPWPTALLEDTRRPDPPDALPRPVRSAWEITRTLLREGEAVLNDPSHISDLARLGTEGAIALGRFALRSPDPKTLFKGDLGIAKRAVWSKPIPLQEAKAVGRMVGGTVNDVMLTAVTGALRSYMRDHGDVADGISIRAIVPVNLRRRKVEFDLGNKFGLVFLTLPIGIADPVERLREVKRCMDELKSTPESAVVFGLMNVMGAVPAELQDIAVAFFGAKATGVMTNAPGPKEKLYLAGAPLDTIMFWVPQSGRLGLGVSILSYARQVWLGMATDEGLVPDPETIVKAFHREFDALSRIAQRKQARRSKATRPMIATLDRASQAVDALKTGEAARAVLEKTYIACRAMTRAGQPCKNHPLPASNLCRVHQRQG